MGKTSKSAAGDAGGQPAALPEDALRDQYAGQGGSYIYDPASGTRKPVEQPNEQAEGQVSDE